MWCGLKESLRLSQVAYLDRLPVGLEDGEMLSEGREQAVVWSRSHQKRLLVAFRGTDDDWREWLQDFRAWKVTTPIGRVHAGLWKSLEVLMTKILPYLQQLDETWRVSLTGHSKGGGMALMCSQFVSTPTRVVTFGAPRVYGAGSARHALHRANTWEVILNADVVPRVPRINYAHVGNVIYCDRNSRWWLNPPLWRRALDMALSLKGSLGDHSLTAYALAVQNPSLGAVL